MKESPIQIGSISLQGFEIPQSVRFGGRHRLAVHNLFGGRRVLERLGPDDGEIVFQGTFSGANAEARVRAFDDLRLSGEIVWLTWETFRRRVVIKSFVAEYHSPWWIPYRVSCFVAYQSGVTAAKSTLSALISADLSTALAMLAGSPVSLASLQGALSSPYATTIGATNNGQAAGSVATTLSVINGQIGQQSALVMAPLAPSTNPTDLGQALTSMVGSAGLLSAAANARGYIGRIGKSLNGTGL